MRRRRNTEPYEAMRRRMIRETEVTLMYGLRFPGRIPRIPTVEVGKGSFDASFAALYWAEKLGLKS